MHKKIIKHWCKCLKKYSSTSNFNLVMISVYKIRRPNSGVEHEETSCSGRGVNYKSVYPLQTF